MKYNNKPARKRRSETVPGDLTERAYLFIYLQISFIRVNTASVHIFKVIDRFFKSKVWHLLSFLSFPEEGIAGAFRKVIYLEPLSASRMLITWSIF